MKQKTKEFLKNSFHIFSPENMAKHLLIAEDGTKYFDRTALIKTRNDMARFIYVIDPLYCARFKNILDLTVYFEIRDNVVWAGTYNLKTKEIESSRPLISRTISTPYTYVDSKLEYIIKLIQSE